MSFEYPIHADVLAAHLNAIMRRICRIARDCPAVGCTSVVNVAGYTYSGKKGTLPGVAGFLPLICCVHGTTGHTAVVAAPIPGYLPDDPFNQRAARTICTQVQSTSIDGNSAWATDVAPTYAVDSLTPPAAVMLGAKIDTAPSGVYVRTGTYLSTRPKSDYGYEYETDDLAFTAWVSPDGIEVD